MVECPACGKCVQSTKINDHLDSGCQTFVVDSSSISSSSFQGPSTQSYSSMPPSQKRAPSSFFHTSFTNRQSNPVKATHPLINSIGQGTKLNGALKRSFDEGPGEILPAHDASSKVESVEPAETGPVLKRTKTNRSAPLAERMRPQSLDDIFGQDLVGPHGVLRSLIESDRLPSMILWGASGTGKTTIARCIANRVASRFIEMNATSSGVAECKKIFGDAANELALTGRKTVVFCDEIHRFTKAQQDVFLKPVEAGTITLIGATTENPSFKVVNALLSRCRTFTLQRLTTADIQRVLSRALQTEFSIPSSPLPPLLDEEFIGYLANFADGDARTALNLLELAISLTSREGMTREEMKASLTKTLVYDRAGDQHYDTISAFHKSVRGSDPDAALYYLARMLQSGEDPLFIARRMVVIASEDVGLADNSLLSLATSTFTATQQIGMPEARIPLAHCAVALSLAPKSTRAYRGLNNAFAALKEPGIAGLPIPIHLRNAPTRLMRELGYGREYKYNPNYKDGKVKQDYLPDALLGRTFLEDRDLGTETDQDLATDGA
ncbi:P-loop containing nucleoside triphosphate hydrolase protein [Durotheca rogersii]|uniref:P-loop containing nucleoside triphosphate hydrolase protein n=1 Tax=Durotheca rogersii TaxID=419775 RepID=UPI002220B156|nr:P-loop containing nucleoside triphosphate hydrolase protein [Durotheca rogersii]KAI5851761.1 P-loop containing nucleoside triphosphate hydrolase protein [Durotheca rogersii]